MIRIDGASETLQAVMLEAVTTTNPSFWASWNTFNSAAYISGSGAGGILNGVTAVALMTGVASRQLTCIGFNVYNQDTVSHTVKIQINDGSVRLLYQCVLQVGESLTYGEDGFKVTNTSGYFLSTLAAAGSNTQVQYNNSGSMGANAGLTFNSSTQQLGQTGTNPSSVMAAGMLPSAPSSGQLVTSIKSLSGRPTPFVTGSSGVARALEYFEATGNKTGWVAGPGNAGTYMGATTGANLGTASNLSPTTTNKYTMMMRNTFASVVTTQNQQVGIRSGAMYFRGNAAGIGGFMFICRFGFTSIKTGMRAFVGMGVGGATQVTADPSGQLNALGFAFDIADTAWTFMHNDGSGTCTKDTISGQTTLATNNTGFDAYIFCYPNDSVVYYRLDDTSQGTTLCDTSASSDLPVNTTGLSFQCCMSNGTANTTAGDATLGISSLIVYTER